MDKVLLKAIERYGLKQLDQTIEELSELIKEISKYKRYKGQDIKEKFYKGNILDEIVDVEIMLEQCKYLLNFEEAKLQQVRLRKIDKLDRHLEKELELKGVKVND